MDVVESDAARRRRPCGAHPHRAVHSRRSRRPQPAIGRGRCQRRHGSRSSWTADRDDRPPPGHHDPADGPPAGDVPAVLVRVRELRHLHGEWSRGRPRCTSTTPSPTTRWPTAGCSPARRCRPPRRSRHLRLRGGLTWDALPIADIIEIEQLLARYAVGMTKDDIDAVIDVFTPDGTYSAFGDTYPLADFPTLVAAAPKGLFLVGPPSSSSTATPAPGQQPLCFVDQTNHDMRIGYYTDTYRRTADGWRLQTRSMTFLRRSGSPRLGQAARPDPARARPAEPTLAMELDEFRAVARRLARRATTATLAPDHAGLGTLDEQMAQLSKVKRLAYDAGWMRWGWPERVGGLGRLDAAARLPRRGAHRPRPGRARHLLDDRGAGADDDRLRRAGAGRRRWCRALLRGDETWCQGFSEPGTGSNLGRARLPGDPDRRRLAGHRPEGVDQPGPVRRSAACSSPGPGTPESAHRGITALFVDMDTPGHHRAADRDDARGARVLRGLLRRRRRAVRPHARRRGPGLVGGHGPAALRAQHRAVAPRRLPAPPAPAAARRRAARRARPGAARARSTQLLLRLPGPVAGHAAPARTPASTSGPETSIDKVLVATAEQAVFDLVADGLGRRRDDRRRPEQRAVAHASSSTRGRRRSTAAAPRSSATSSPAASSTSGTTGDGRRRPGAVRAEPPARDRARTGARSTPPSRSWAGATR